MVAGCQREQAFDVSSAGGTDGERGRTTLDVKEGWDSIGVYHNLCMEYVDGRLVSEWKEDWDLDSTLRFTRGAVIDFMIDSMKYDPEDVAKLFEVVDIDDIEPTYEYVRQCLASLDSMQVVSSREVEFLNRLFQFAYNGDTTTSVFADSLEAFVTDVTAIEWKDDEVACLALTAVVMHSWDFQNTGWNFEPVTPRTWGWDWKRTAVSDLAGAAAGAVGLGVAKFFPPPILGPIGLIVAAAAAASAFDGVMQAFGY